MEAEMEQIIVLLIGFISAVLMFIGDMTLYYDRNDYCSVSMTIATNSAKYLHIP